MPRKGKKNEGWQNRIVGHGVKAAKDFKLNDLNWRVHPDKQRAALDEILALIGWVTGVIENVQTGNVIDGHARIQQALAKGDDTPVPYTQVDLTEEEERQVLAVFDPIGGMAGTDEDKLQELLDAAGIQSEILLEVLAGIQDVDLSDISEDPDPNLNDPNFNYENQFGVIVTCDSEAHQQEVFDALTAQGYTVKVVVV